MLELNCLLLGDPPGKTFTVKIDEGETVGYFIEIIKEKKKSEFDHLPADSLELSLVSIPYDDIEASLQDVKDPMGIPGAQLIRPLDKLKVYFRNPLKNDHIHILVWVPIMPEFEEPSKWVQMNGDVMESSNLRMRKWTINGAIRDTDTIGCYYLDPGTQHASKVCLDAVTECRYVQLWGAPASGKSTRLLSLQRELALRGYRALYLTFEHILYHSGNSAFWKSIGDALQLDAYRYPSLPPISISSQTDFLGYFQTKERDVVLLIDEFSQLYHAPSPILNECLRTFRGIRAHVGYGICSIIMAGTISVLHLNPTDTMIAPFNVSNPIANPYFSLDDTRKLFSGFAQDNDIMIDDAVVDDVWFKSNGHPGMVCLCGHMIAKYMKSLLDHDSKTLSYQKWQRFPTERLYGEISSHNTFSSLINLLLRDESHAAVVFLRSHFAGYLNLVEVTQEDVVLAHFLTAEGVLLKPNIAMPWFCVASPLLDGLIRNLVIPAKFPSAPSVAPPKQDNEAALNVLDVLIESLKFFDKDLIHLAASCSHKEPSVKVPGSQVPRESVYGTELMRILLNWLQGLNGWTVTSQWHLKNDLEHKYPDIILKKSDNLTVVLKLLATEDQHSVQSHIEKTPECMALLLADEAWVIHFTCQDPYRPIWESPAGLGRGVNVVHFAHDLAFTKVLMSARWQNRTGNIEQVINRPLMV